MTDPAPRRLRVLACDDHALFRRAIVTALEDADFDVVAEATTGAEAVSQALEHAPDVVLMDLRMPDGNGSEATAGILAARPWTRVCVLSVSDDLDEITDAIRAGAIAHLRKEEAMVVLPEVVRDVADGGVRIGSALARRLRHELTRVVEAADAGADVGPWRPRSSHIAMLEALGEGVDLAEAARTAGIRADVARTELRATLEGLHRTARPLD